MKKTASQFFLVSLVYDPSASELVTIQFTELPQQWSNFPLTSYLINPSNHPIHRPLAHATQCNHNLIALLDYNHTNTDYIDCKTVI